MAIGILMDSDDVSDRFAPREFVAMVLERPNEDHRALARWYLF
jgi:hypothetical protein